MRVKYSNIVQDLKKKFLRKLLVNMLDQSKRKS